jgi:hypothetical protein
VNRPPFGRATLLRSRDHGHDIAHLVNGSFAAAVEETLNERILNHPALPAPSTGRKSLGRASFPAWWLGLSISLVSFAASAAQTTEKVDPAQLEFFESKIRPILVENCYKCHSHDSEKVKGGLLLDTKDSVLKGGDNGPAVIPGFPDKSLLIKAVRYTDEDLQMPPKGKKLAPAQVRALEEWVKMGAPDPRSGATVLSASKAKASSHWSYQPVRTPPIPQSVPRAWIKNPVDAFILAKLDEQKLRPSPPADRRTLIRRAYFDLIGLPPKPEEAEAFEKDRSPDAFANVVDHLLSLPEYGERWGRHWLDVARYADTKGYVFEEERRYAYSYTYRDYVIRSFNEDLPYNRFLLEQIAADQLDLGADKRPLAALGFLTLGRRFLNNQPDIIDDRIDVVTRGLMGMTVSCARCHDHKFDPIPTADYYSLYGVFESCHEPAEEPLLGDYPKEYQDYLAEKQKKQKALEDFRTKKEDAALLALRQKTGEFMLAVADTRRIDDALKAEQLEKGRKLDPGIVRRWKLRLTDSEAACDPVLAPWVALTALDDKEFAAKAPGILAALGHPAKTNNTVNPLVLQAIREDQPWSAKELSEVYGDLFTEADAAWMKLRKSSTEARALANPDLESIRQILYADGSPASPPRGELTRLLDTPAQQKIRALRRESEALDATHPGAPSRAMALLDNDTPSQPRIFKRGSPSNPGDEVPRQAPAILGGPNRQPFKKGSGRLELARVIASKDNPLTARVFVNRVWLLHFGSGLVRTPSDFGTRSEPPTNPALLDYLASRFMEEGWSVKKLHRLIMLSSAYQQGSDENEACAKIDPANDFYWRMNRQRLDFEGLRDSLLSVSERLDPAVGGRPVDIVDDPQNNRRTVYGFIDRQNLPGMMRTFDFATPDASSAQRYYTTVPQQALFLMNSPFAALQARALEAAIPPDAKTDAARIRWLYERLYQRPPSREDARLAESFFKKIAGAPTLADQCWSYGFGEFSGAQGKVVAFSALPTYASESWRGGEKLPDPTLGWVMLNAAGGHPGDDARHAAIRRWTAPYDGSVRVEGTLGHKSEAGDGVRGRIVSSRAGLLGEWIAHHQETPTRVETAVVRKGDTIDFVADLRETVTSDSFTWAPRVQYLEVRRTKESAKNLAWDAARDFSSQAARQFKPLDAWGKYAQVLLESNEFIFAD